MTVAHIVVITPRRCGLYETTRELVAGLRQRGVDARMVDPTYATNTLYPNGQSDDRGAVFASVAWARTADVLVNHSGLGDEFNGCHTPVVHVAHGRPRSSFLSERDGGTPIYSYHYAKNADPQVRRVVTFWPEHVPYLQVMFPDTPVTYVQAPVDLEEWTIDGPTGYGFHGHAGRINVVCADAWRDDVDPFTAVNAFALWAREVQGAKLHLYGAHPERRGWGALLKRLRDDGTLGEVKGWVGGLAHVYRAADCLVTPNEIDVRTVREAMACGCPVVRFPRANLTGYRSAFTLALDEPRTSVRARAEQLFNPAHTAAEFHAVLERAA